MSTPFRKYDTSGWTHVRSISVTHYFRDWLVCDKCGIHVIKLQNMCRTFTVSSAYTKNHKTKRPQLTCSIYCSNYNMMVHYEHETRTTGSRTQATNKSIPSWRHYRVAPGCSKEATLQQRYQLISMTKNYTRRWITGPVQWMFTDQRLRLCEQIRFETLCVQGTVLQQTKCYRMFEQR